jgi:hypothetical protein
MFWKSDREIEDLKKQIRKLKRENKLLREQAYKLLQLTSLKEAKEDGIHKNKQPSTDTT